MLTSFFYSFLFLYTAMYNASIFILYIDFIVTFVYKSYFSAIYRCFYVDEIGIFHRLQLVTLVYINNIFD